MSTGYPVLDAELPGGGWPAQGLMELLCDAPEEGVWSLLAPAFGAQRDEAAGMVVCISAPQEPCATALAWLGLAPDRLLRVQAETLKEAAWAAEQAVRSQACAAVVWWMKASVHGGVGDQALRRLHWAAQQTRTPVWIVRERAMEVQPSPAALRMVIEPAAPDRWGWQFRIFKRRGMPMTEALHLDHVESPSISKRWLALTSRWSLMKSAGARSPESSDAVVRLSSALFAA